MELKNVGNTRKSSNGDSAPLLESPHTSSDEEISPRPSALSADETHLYQELKKINTQSNLALWDHNGLIHNALHNQKEAAKYLAFCLPRVWLMYSRCKTSEDFRLYVIQLSKHIIAKNADELKKLIEISNDNRPHLDEQRILGHFVNNGLFPYFLAAYRERFKTAQNARIDPKNFIKFIEDIPDAEMQAIYNRLKEDITLADIAISEDIPAKKAEEILTQLFNGQMSDAELFDNAYGFKNYLTSQSAKSSHETPYAACNQILLTLNNHFLKSPDRDINSVSNRMMTLYSITNGISALQTSLDKKLALKTDMGTTVQTTPIEVQRNFMQVYHEPVSTLNRQNHTLIAKHFETVQNAANKEFFKLLYFSGKTQTQLAQFLGMPEEKQPYDQFLKNASQLRSGSIIKQALIDVLKRVDNNELSHRGFHAEIKKIIHQFSAPKFTVKTGVMRFFAYARSYFMPRQQGAALRAQYDQFDRTYFQSVFEDNGDALREQYREVDQLRALNRDYKAAYFSNQDKLTKDYIESIDPNHIRTVIVNERQSLQQLDARPSVTNYWTMSRSLQKQDSVYKNALSKSHSLAKVRAKDALINPTHLDAHIAQIASLEGLGANIKPEERRELRERKTEVQKYLNAAGRHRFKAEVREFLVEEGQQPIMQRN